MHVLILIGNLIFRTVNLIYKNCEQKIPTPDEFNEKDSKLLTDAYGAIFKIRNASKNINKRFAQITA